MITTMVDDVLDSLPTIGLAELNAAAALQTRTDRKYLLAAPELEQALHLVAGRAEVLTIEDRKRFGYESVYFDTPGFDSFLAAARGRPSRFKVRTRVYQDSGWRVLEVKERSRRGQTVKYRADHGGADAWTLAPTDREFLSDFALVAPFVESLHPALTTRYLRTTLLIDASSRATIDADVRAEDGGGRGSRFTSYILETKSTGAPSPLDRALWSLHRRPTKVSKYGTGLASLRRDLPANKWHHVLQRHVAVG